MADSDKPDETTTDKPTTTATAQPVNVTVPLGLNFSFTNDAQKIIIVSMTITGIVSLVEHLATPTTPNTPANTSLSVGSIMVGTFVATGLLLGMSYFLPEFASGLAIVAMTATLFDRGKPFWDIVSKVVGNSAPAPSAVPPAVAVGGAPAPHQL
jgi:hypothetical protein